MKRAPTDDLLVQRVVNALYSEASSLPYFFLSSSRQHTDEEANKETRK